MTSPTSSNTTPSLKRSDSISSTSSSVYSEISEPSSLENVNGTSAALASPDSNENNNNNISAEMEQKRKYQQQLIIATSDYYDYALKMERLTLEQQQTLRDKQVLKRQAKRAKTVRLIDMGPENSRLIGHTQETLDSKLQFTEDEIKRVKMLMKRIKQQYPDATRKNVNSQPFALSY